MLNRNISEKEKKEIIKNAFKVDNGMELEHLPVYIYKMVKNSKRKEFMKNIEKQF